MNTNLQLYDENIRPIKRVEFDIWGNDEILRVSALGKDSLGINIPDLYDNMEPKRGGLIDTRLGPTTNGIECATCGLDSTNCIGHFGHIDLAEYIFHMGYRIFVKKILSNVCLKCSKLLVYKNEDELFEMLKNKSGKSRFAEIRNLTKNVTHCAKPGYGCGTPVSKIKLEIKKSSGVVNIIAEFQLQSDEGATDPTGKVENNGKKTIKQVLEPDMCYNILKHIDDTDCMLMGIDPKRSRPENMIHKIFPVSPVAIRPSAKVDFLESSTKEDDLTHKLADIVKANIKIRKFKESSNDATAKYGPDHVNLLQYQVYSNFDNESSEIPKSEQRNKATKSLSSRLKGKEGRIRGNLMGKRVNFSARTVITSDPTIDMNELRVPIKIAKNLTFPEVVTPQNKERLTQLVRNGRNKYPGANFVFPAGNNDLTHKIQPKDLRIKNDEVELRYGDIVERHIVDGDIVLLNRQPTLHKLSMMAHKIRVINDEKLNTFGVSVCDTTPYNADFDGDEMNIFLPQSNQTRIELEEIADVQKNIITPALSVPIIGIVQDGLLGAYNLSQPSMNIDWKSAMNMISYTSLDDFDFFKKKEGNYKGSDIFSLIIPSRINKTGQFEVVNGHIEKGVLNKSMLGAKRSNSLIHMIWDEYGYEETRKFIDNTQRLINNFNLWNGFSVGIGDIDITNELQDQLNKLFETKKLEVEHAITEIENNPDLIDPEVFEQNITSELATIRDNVSKLIMTNLMATNRFNIMITSGSKGEASNMGQMRACIGQQLVEGNRIPKKFNGRPLAYNPQGDDRAPARGFVQQPYIDGAKPEGFIHHNMASREGLIDTAIKTAESGYIQRKLVKALEDVSIKYDNTSRTANGTIIQFCYGDSGCDTTKQSPQTLSFLEMGNKEIADKIKFTPQELKNFKNFTSDQNDEFYNRFLKMRNSIRKSRMKTSLNNITFDSNFHIAVNIKNVINVEKNTNKNKTSGDLDPTYIINRLVDILEYDNTKVLTMTEEDKKNPNSLKYRDEMLSKLVFSFALCENLAPKICIFEYGLNKVQFDNICNRIIKSFNNAIVQPGENVGTIAAQSIGEPVTQMSCEKNTRVIIIDSNKHVFYGTISEFIDNLMNKNTQNVVEFEKDHYLLDLIKPEDQFYIIGVSDKEKNSWNKILQISKHPANGGLVKVTTKTGKTTVATLSHSFLKRTTNSITTVKGSQLKLGDRIPIAKNIPEIENPLTEIKIGDKVHKLDKKFGWICGVYLANGSIQESNTQLTDFLDKYFGEKSYNKQIPGFVFASNKDFISGIIGGYFDKDGNVSSDKQIIMFGSRSERLITDMSLLLSYFGIYSTKHQENNNQTGKVIHTLSIARKCANIFKHNIGSLVREKSDELNKLVADNNKSTKKTLLDKMDKIPELGSTVSKVAKLLQLDDQGKLYRKCENKSAINRDTLKKHIDIFETENKRLNNIDVRILISELKQAVESDIIWDEIVDIQELEDPKEYVYDFTVPGNDSFMVDGGILVHNTLNTFHQAGIGSSVALGVPRIKELLSLSKNIKTPVMQIFLEKHLRNNSEIAHRIESYLKYTTIKDIRKKIDVFYDPDPLKENGFMKRDGVFNIFYSHNPNKNSCQGEVTSLPWLMRLELDREKMMEKDITLLDIKSKFCNNWERRYNDIKGLRKEERTLLSKIIQVSVLSNSDNSKVPVLHIRFDMTEFDFSNIIGFIDVFIDNFKLKGMNNINKINGVVEEPIVNFDNENEELQKEKHFVIYTSGINMVDIRYLNGIDLTRSFCNDVITIYQIFGIDAARAALMKEFKSVFSAAGNNVNYAHLETLCDLMTNSGILTSVDRHSMNKSETDPLARASFEKSVDQLLTAAVFGEIDYMNSVSSRIMAGLVIKSGTGLCNIILDAEMLEKSEYIEDMEQKYVKSYNEVMTDSLMNDINNKTVSGIFIPQS